MKIVNDNISQQAQQKIIQDVHRKRLVFQNRYALKARKELNNEVKWVLNSIKEYGVATTLLNIDRLPTNWLPYYQDLYLSTGGSFAEYTAGGLKTLSKYLTKEVRPEILALVEAYVQEVSGDKITWITATSIRQFKAVLSNAIDEGEGVTETMRTIRETFPNVTYLRSEVIARTEVVAASNYGSLASAQNAGLQLSKVWLSTRDDRTRETPKADHVHMNSQKVELAGVFIEKNSGDRMRFAGDSSLGASAANIIQCRCTQIYKRR